MGRTACAEPQYSYTSAPSMGRTTCTEPQYSYTSTPSMGRTTCTEPQCLYKGTLYFYFCGSNTYGVKIKCSEKSLSYSQFVHPKVSHGLAQDSTRASAVRVRPCEPLCVQIVLRREILENTCIPILFSMLESRNTSDILNRATAASFTSIDSRRYFPNNYRSLYKIVWTTYIREDRLSLVVCEETSANFAYCDECVLCRRNYSRDSFYIGVTFSDIWL